MPSSAVIARGQFSQQARRVLRPVFVTACYLVAFIGLQKLTVDLQVLPQVGSWNLAAGLSLGILVGYGFNYVPVVFAAHLVDTLSPTSSDTTNVKIAILAVTITAFYALISLAIRRLTVSAEPGRSDRATLRSFLLFLVPGAIGASLVTTLNWYLGGALERDAFLDTLLEGAAGNAVGMLVVAPFVLLLCRGWLESLLDRLTGIGRHRPGTETATMATIRLVAILAGSGGFFYLVLHLLSDRFILFVLLSLPLVATALKYGLHGAVGCLAVLGFVSIIRMELHQPQDALWTQLEVIGACLNSLLVGSLASEQREEHKITRQQAGLLSSVSFATEQLLRTTDQQRKVNDVLAQLASEAGVTRAYIMDNRQEAHASAVPPIYEYWNGNDAMDADYMRLVNVLRRKQIRESAEPFAQGKAVQYRTADLPDEEQAILQALDIRIAIILPIFADGRWWGCLGIDQTTTDRLWTQPEVDAFSATARALGALLAHTNVEQQFRQFTGNIPAVFWIASPNGRDRTYVSPAYEQIWGWPCESIYKNPESWIAAIYHEDYAAVRDALAKQMWGKYDEEYRIVRSDRSVRWIRDTGFPVRDASGEVSRIVGIAQDITAQKEAEERLRATSLLLSTLIDNLQAGIVVEDQSRRVMHVNQAFCKMFTVEAPRESLLGVDSRLVFAQQDRHQIRSEQVISRGDARHGDEMISKDDRIFSRDYIPLSMNGDCHYHLWRYEDITDRRRSEERIRASLKEKEVLLKEIHHRVKNNLQVISSLLNLQATQIRDHQTAQVFKDSQSRVKAMALVHERLYQSADLARIDFAGYVRDVTSHLLRSYQTTPRGVLLKLEVESLNLNIDTAIPCALIINELVSNSLKYAFPNGRQGEIRIRMAQNGGGNMSLVISDNGVGFPGDVSFQRTDSLGLQLVRSLVDQLNGTVQFNKERGTEFDIQFRPVVNDCRN